MFTVFFNGTGACTIEILPEGQKMNNTYFITFVLQPLAEFCYAEGSKTYQRKVMAHFSGAPARNTEWVREDFVILGFRRIGHTTRSPDLAPHDFALFGTVKKNLSGQPFDRLKKHSVALKSLLRISYKGLFWNDQWNYRYAVKETENTLNEHCKMAIFGFATTSACDENPGEYRTRCHLNSKHSFGFEN
jgi:hypothetical protein